MSCIDWTVDCGVLGEIDLEITYKYSPGTPDVHTLPNGDPGYPGDPAECEFLKVIYAGRDVGWLFEDALEEDDDLHEAIAEQEAEDADEAAAED